MKLRQAFVYLILLFAIAYFFIYDREPLQSVQFSIIMSGLLIMIRR
ncbi:MULTISPECIES: hypothetical protein [Ureibacillus]|jgi:hypothetical protein|uniref:Preprotein translocase subunit YajC n=1 Tax=Ureibacillus thermosphaericus TaxID=51173 RepID=A0A840PPQ8_URETH|nr:hypothetical protein [Ureibacillus thermosphaericus]MBB5148023.1 preprotein translocase subunit YajC [Ureibacillus thermosphaericus]NKZ30733.1 hypothetical protein [Ureibacillus thermosphaericus]